MESTIETLKLGYARVSTDKKEGREQTLDQQIDELLRAGVLRENIYAEKISGSVNLEKGAEWLALKERAVEESGSVEIVAVSWSRISRNVKMCCMTAWALADDEGCVFTIIRDPRYQQIALTESMDILTFVIDLTQAQMFREQIAKATKAKLDYLKEQGVKLGPPAKLTARDHEAIRRFYFEDGMGGGRIADILTDLRIYAIPAEVKSNEEEYARALKHARVSKSLISPLLRELKAEEAIAA